MLCSPCSFHCTLVALIQLISSTTLWVWHHYNLYYWGRDTCFPKAAQSHAARNCCKPSLRTQIVGNQCVWIHSILPITMRLLNFGWLTQTLRILVSSTEKDRIKLDHLLPPIQLIYPIIHYLMLKPRWLIVIANNTFLWLSIQSMFL